MAKSISLKASSANFVFAFLAIALMFVCAENAHAQTTILDNIGNTYKNAASGWSGTLFSIAKGLFLKLALLEMLWFGIMFVLEKDDPKQFLVMLLKKMMALLFFYAILLNFDSWIPAIIDGFSQAGATAGQTGTLTPSGVMERGLSLSTAILEKAQELDWTDVGPFLLAVLVSIMILLAFVVIAGQMLVTLIESYIVVSAGVLFLGFAGSRWTTTFAEKFISFAVSTGVKLFVTYLIIGAGQNLSNTWLGAIQAAPDPSGYLEVLAGAIVYTFLAWQIPSLASSMLTGSVSMTLGGAAATAGTLAGAGIGAAGVAATMATGAAGGAAAISKTLGAAIGASRAGGASGTLGVAAGAVGALGSAAAGAVSDGIKGLGGAGETSGLAGRLNSTAASLNELKASSGVSAPSVPGSAGAGQQTSAPSAPSASQNQAPTPQPAQSTPETQSTPESKLEQPNTAASNSAATSSTGAAGSTAQPGQASAGTAGSTAGSESLPASNVGESATTQGSTTEPSADVVETSAPAPVESAQSGETLQAQGEQVSAPTAETSQVPSSTAAAENSAPVNQSPAPSAPTAQAQPQPSRPTPSAPAATGSTQPKAPVAQAKPSLSQRLQEGAKSVGDLPNDAAPGAGVQINLKAD